MFRKKKIALEESEFSFRRFAWKQFKKSKMTILSLWLLIFLSVIALFASFIATDQPLYAKYRGKTFYPAFNQHWLLKSVFGTANSDSTLNPETKKWETIQFDIVDWKQLDLESVWWAPIPHSPKKQDIYNRDFASPGDTHYYKNNKGEIVSATGKFRHLLGTDMLGRDVLSGLIHATKISLLVGILSMTIAVIIGLSLGALAGYLGDYRLQLSRMRLLLFIPGIVLGYFYAFQIRAYSISDAFASSTAYGLLQLFLSCALFLIIAYGISYCGKIIRKGYFSQRIFVPIDSYISRFMEVFNALPRLLLIITISAIIQERSIWMVMLIIGFTSWVDIARFTRAELLKVRELDFIQSARALGYSEKRIIFRHALPNSLSPVFVSIAFGIAAAILIESGLSFLNIGVPDDVVTWGSMLNIGRTEPEAWWLIIFPGLAIFLTITIYNLIGEGLRDALDPKLKK